MQIRALIYFDELVRTNSMRQAAENLNVAPTAISRQIENLEYHFGTPLGEGSAPGGPQDPPGERFAGGGGRARRVAPGASRGPPPASCGRAARAGRGATSTMCTSSSKT
jgi:hypothetical protein